MSRREDIVSCIDVTMMDRSAHSALPSSYSEIFPAFGAGAAFTHATGLGAKRFIDFLKPHACVSAFIQQHGSECAPAGIQHRLGLSGLSQRRGIHIADEHSTVGLDQAGAQFVQEIFSPIRDLGVNRAGPLSMAGALCAGHADIQIPASAAVFTEITRTQFEASQTVAVPQRQPTPREVDLSPSIANRSDLKGNPAQRPAGTATLAPGQSDFSMLSAPPRVFFRDLLYRLDRKMQGAL